MDADVREPTTPGPYWLTHDPGGGDLCVSLWCVTPSGWWKSFDDDVELAWDDVAANLVSIVPATPPRTPAPSLQAAREAVATLEGTASCYQGGALSWHDKKAVATLRALLDWLDGGVRLHLHRETNTLVAGEPRLPDGKWLDGWDPVLVIPLPKEDDDDVPRT